MDPATWRGPTLTIAGQAFLLNVLAIEGPSQIARAAILVAGLLTLVGASIALLHLGSRERLYAVADRHAQRGTPSRRRPGASREGVA